MKKEIKGKVKRYIYFLIVILLIATFYRVMVLGELKAALNTIIILSIYLLRKKIKKFISKHFENIKQILIEELRETANSGYEELSEEELENENEEKRVSLNYNVEE